MMTTNEHEPSSATTEPRARQEVHEYMLPRLYIVTEDALFRSRAAAAEGDLARALEYRRAADVVFAAQLKIANRPNGTVAAHD